jgi:Protein of unknown function (DUF2510)
MVVSAAVAHRIPAGWYRDRDDRSLRRWWDGAAWTDYYSPYTLPILVSREAILASAELEAANAAAASAAEAVAATATATATFKLGKPGKLGAARHPSTVRLIVWRYLPFSIVATLIVVNVVLTIILASGD